MKKSLKNCREIASDVSKSTIFFARMQNRQEEGGCLFQGVAASLYRVPCSTNMIVEPILVVRPRGNCSVAERDFWLVSTGVALVFRPSFRRGLLLAPLSLSLSLSLRLCCQLSLLALFSLSTGRLGCSSLEKLPVHVVTVRETSGWQSD